MPPTPSISELWNAAGGSFDEEADHERCRRRRALRGGGRLDALDGRSERGGAQARAAAARLDGPHRATHQPGAVGRPVHDERYAPDRQRDRVPICHPICHIAAMRTTLDIDDDLLAALLARYPGSSKTEAIETALRAYLSEDAVSRLRRLAGTLDIEDVSATIRAHDRRS